MQQETLDLLSEVNRAIIKFRRTYSLWSNAHNISYHEMLVYYTVREQGFCTQKQICENYLLPKQTVNHVFAALQKAGILLRAGGADRGREKVFVLSEKGKKHAAPLLRSLDEAESRALERLGEEKLRTLTDLLMQYDRALGLSLGESR